MIKKRFKNYEKYTPLVDRTLAMIFEKASTRTRVSFEAGMYQMGGSVVNLTTGDSQLGRAEPVEDSARVISRMVDIVMIRTFEQTKLEAFAAQLARAGDQRPDQRVPPVPDPGRRLHLHRAARQRSRARSVAWVGDGNNMANTWLQAADILGFTLHVSTPSGYEIDADGRGRRAQRLLQGLPATRSTPAAAPTSSPPTSGPAWATRPRTRSAMKAFADWCVDREMMAAAQPDALFMHCLPAHRGEEVEAEVIDGPQSVVWDEAENRMHVQKALMEYLLLGRIG